MPLMKAPAIRDPLPPISPPILTHAVMTSSASLPTLIAVSLAWISTLGTTYDTYAQATTPLPTAPCAEVWQQEVAADFAKLLTEVTQTQHDVWPAYRLGDGAVVLHAGNTDDDQACLGLWKHGKILAYAAMEETPKLATPLYGYYLNFGTPEDTTMLPLSTLSKQPEAISQWLDEHSIDSAVLMPVDFPKFPFKIPTLMKVQTAIHEAFHVDVMIRYWFTGTGHWPAWDKQPDRSSLQNCYAASDTAKEAIRSEQLLLANLVQALVAEENAQACDLGSSFLESRANRYDLLADVTVPRYDGTPGSCQEAENIMELEEGLADYASWTMLYDIGTASWEDLHRRYQAIQKEPFYLTGAMLMHAATLMHDGETTALINAITTSQTVQEGALATHFADHLNAFCAK